MIPEVKLDELYQEVILDHNRRPRNWGKLEHPTAYSHGHNPLCGDDYHLYLEVVGDTIKAVRFEGQGCAISKSSASMMTEAISGKSKAAVAEMKNNFVDMLTSAETTDAHRKAAGNLKLFEGVKHFPIRVKCATLAWHALEDALKDIR